MVGELLVRVLRSVMVWSQRELGSGRRWSGRGEAGWWLLEAAVLLFELATRRARFGRDCWMSRWVARCISVQVDSAVMFVQTLISRGGQTRPLLFGRMYDDGSRTRSLEEHGARDALTKQSPILQPITNTAKSALTCTTNHFPPCQPHRRRPFYGKYIHTPSPLASSLTPVHSEQAMMFQPGICEHALSPLPESRVI